MILILCFLPSCTSINIDALPMMDTSTVRYVTVSVYGITGFKGMIIDRYQYDPVANKETLLKSDAFGPGSQPIKLPNVPFIP